MKTVIEMARKIWSAGDVYIGPSEKTLQRFAELVHADAIAAEREACAQAWGTYWDSGNRQWGTAWGKTRQNQPRLYWIGVRDPEIVFVAKLAGIDF